jgi:hypothetical protein
MTPTPQQAESPLPAQQLLFTDAANAGRHGGPPRTRGATATPQELHELVRRLDGLELHLERLDTLLTELVELVTVKGTVKEFYTTDEAAVLLGKRPFTVRNWCRLGRVNAVKARAGRGVEEEWRIAHAEILRIQNEGLLPPAEPARGLPRLR